MLTGTAQQRTNENIRQLSVFTANRLGRLHEVIGVLAAERVQVLALTVVDATDSAIIRLVLDDPDKARRLLLHHDFPFTECELLVVETDYLSDVNKLIAALLEAELNINYLYSFIAHPGGKSLLALNMEDNEIAEAVLKRHQFRVLKQSDISR